MAAAKNVIRDERTGDMMLRRMLTCPLCGEPTEYEDNGEYIREFCSANCGWSNEDDIDEEGL